MSETKRCNKRDEYELRLAHINELYSAEIGELIPVQRVINVLDSYTKILDDLDDYDCVSQERLKNLKILFARLKREITVR